MNVYATGTLSAGDEAGAIGELKIGTDNQNEGTNLTLQNNSTLHIDFKNGSGYVAGIDHDHIMVEGNVALGTDLNISLSSLAAGAAADSGDASTARTIVTATGTMSAAPTTANLLLNGLSLADSRASGTVTLAVSGKELQITDMTLSNNQNKNVTWTGDSAKPTHWDLSSINWTDDDNSDSPCKFLDGDAVTFKTTTDTTINIQGTQKTVAGMVVENFNGLTINGNIHASNLPANTNLTGATGKLVKKGNGLLRLNGDNTFEDGIDVEKGTLVLGSQTSAGSADIVIKSDGWVFADYTGAFANKVTGDGNVNISGSQAVTFIGKNKEYTGGTYINSGAMLIAGETGALSANSLHRFSGNAVLDLNGKDQTIAGLRSDDSDSTASSVLLGSATLTLNQTSNQTFTGVISGTGELVKEGARKQTLTGVNAYTGDTTVNAGTLALAGNGSIAASSGLSMTDFAIFDISGVTTETAIQSLASSDATTMVTLGGKTLKIGSGNTDTTFAGIISGSGVGGITKEGTGTLTLSGTNTYIGKTTVADGTLALGTNGSIATSTLVIDKGATFDIKDVTGDPTVSGLEVAVGSSLTANGKTLNLKGSQNVVFDLEGISSTNLNTPVLAVTGTGGLDVDEYTKITLKNAADSLQVGDEVILATAATGTTNADPVTSGRWKFGVEVTDDYKLLAEIIGIDSFVSATDDYLGDAAPGNANIQGLGKYLDWLAEQPFGASPGMNAIDNYFTDITDLPVPEGKSEFGRFSGAYSAYANRPLQDDADRFRRRWRRQNHFFLDRFVFTGLHSGPVPAGFASASGLGSPLYGPRDCVPVGESRLWAGGFGTWSKQDSRSGLAGYDYDSRGLALGFEHSRDRLHLGFAAAYSRGELEIDSLGYKNKPDIMNLALYGTYAHDSGLYLEGGLGYGHAWNSYRADLLLGGRKTGKYGSDVFSADLELGYIARLGCDVNLIPTVGVEYDYVRNGSWTESVSAASTAPANRFASARDHGLDVPLGLRLNKAFRFANGGFVIPEVRAGYVYTANKSRPAIRSSFAGAPGGMTMRGVDPGRSHWRFAAGLSGQLNRRVDFQVEYEFETRSGFRGHNVNANIGLSF